MTATRGRVLNVPMGVPFLATLADALWQGHVILGFPDPKHALSLASATIFVPTQRAARDLRSQLASRSPNGVAVMPDIVPLGRLESFILDADDEEAPTRDAHGAEWGEASEFEKRFTLAILIQRWAQQLPGAIVHIEADGSYRIDETEANLIGSSLASAWRMAGELGGLIDELVVEQVAVSALGALNPEEFDRWWKITHDFLKIAIEGWQGSLRDRRLEDRVERQMRLVDRQIARLGSAQSGGPVIVAGSTGANAATARLLGAVAAASNGAVVLPGVDMHLDATAWALLANASDARESVATHPQATLARTLIAMGVRRDALVQLGTAPSSPRLRDHLLSEALRPAETTDVWTLHRAQATPADIQTALADVCMIEAWDEREEALCIAIRIRAALESGERVALVTPDRNIARRTRAQLLRWNLFVEDSAGEALGRTQCGSLARLVLTAALGDRDADMLALLTHGLSRLGRDPIGYDRAQRLLDLGLVRAGRSPFQTRGGADSTGGARPHPNAEGASAQDWAGVHELVGAAQKALEPLQLGEPLSTAQWADRHRGAIAMVRQSDESLAGEGADELDAVLDQLSEHGGGGAAINLQAYAALFDQLAAETPVRPHPTGDNRVQILGLLEARLMHFDTVILAGLEEGVWPPKARTDPFLNRAMRAKLGLTPPERRIGQTAHDFVQLMGANQAVLTRAIKRDGSPTTASRFLQRFVAFVGEESWAACKQGGRLWIALARRLEQRPHQSSTPPRPRPPLDLRPTTLSVTRIETLRREPYAIYAEKILRLQPVEPLDVTLGRREFGTALHAVLARFAAKIDWARKALPPCDDLFEIARAEFDGFFSVPGFAEFEWPRLKILLQSYYGWEREHLGEISRLKLEQVGNLKIPLEDGSIFTLTARMDRMEVRSDGTTRLVDFKSGGVPSNRDIQAGFAPQLILEGIMVAGMAFGPAPSGEICAAYVAFSGRKDVSTREIGAKEPFLETLMRDQHRGLLKLLNQMRKPDFVYVSRPYPDFASRFSPFDHLSRLQEWSAASDEGADS